MSQMRYAAYLSQTKDKKHFTIPEVAADWHELKVHYAAIHK